MKLLNLKKDQTDLCLTENILSDKDTTCSVRLNRNPLKVDCGSMPIYSYKIESYLLDEKYKYQFVTILYAEYHVNGSAGYLVLCRNLDIQY